MKYKTINSTKKLNDDGEFGILPIFPTTERQSRLQIKETVLRTYEYKLFGEIGEVDDYFDIIDALNDATTEDEFIIRIDSGGGLLGTADIIINAIENTQARVHGHIEKGCGSAATLVFLACHSYSMTPRAEFFVHTASCGTVGKEHENYASMMFTRKRIHRVIRDAYTGLLTDSEIDNVLNGQDYYFDADELGERLEVYIKFKQEKFEEEMEAFAKEQEKALEEAFEKPKKKKQLLN